MKIKRFVAGIALAFHLSSASALAQNAYITNFASNTVSVLNTATGTVTGNPIDVGSAPYGVAVSPDGSRVYLTNQFSNSVSAIDTATETVIATITVGSGPAGVAITPDGSKVYVTNQFSQDSNNDSTVSVINTRTNAVTTVPIPSSPPGIPSNPLGVAVSPDGRKVYVGTGLGTVSVIDTASNTVALTLQIGLIPIKGVTVSPDGHNVYVVNGSLVQSSQVSQITNSVSIIAINSDGTLTLKATIPVGDSPLGVAVSPDGSKIYVANTKGKEIPNGVAVGTVSVIDTATETVTATIAVGTSTTPSGPSGVAFSTDGSKIYVANTDSNSVSVIDTATNAVTTITNPSFNLPVAFGVFIQPRFAGTPRQSNCFGVSVAALAQQYRGLNASAAALGYPSVPALQQAIMTYCGG
jgi:YVTN family beta-propeller protein